MYHRGMVDIMSAGSWRRDFLYRSTAQFFAFAFGVALSIAATSLTFVSNGVLGLFVYLLAAIAAVALIISQKMAGNPYVRLLAKMKNIGSERIRTAGEPRRHAYSKTMMISEKGRHSVSFLCLEPESPRIFSVLGTRTCS